MTSSDRDEGAILIEAALIMPLFIILLAGGLILGLATVEQLRLERAAGDAAVLTEIEARQLIATVHGELVCYWRGSDEGECFDDGLEILRTQIVARGRTWFYPTGRVTPTVQVTRPTEGETNG